MIEIPTPRWTACDVKYCGAKPVQRTPMMLQERAHTSPVWYTPQQRIDTGGPRASGAAAQRSSRSELSLAGFKKFQEQARNRKR